MPLAAEQIQELQEIFLKNYSDQVFETILGRIERPSYLFVGRNDNFPLVVTKIIESAKRGGWLRQLIQQAITYHHIHHKQQDLRLMDFLDKYGDKIDQETPLQTQEEPIQNQDFSLLISLCNPEESPSQLLKTVAARHKNLMIERQRILPLICIVHGDNEDLLNKYRERLATIELNEILETGSSKKTVIKQVRLPWKEKGEDFAESLSEILNEAWLGQYENNGKENSENSLPEKKPSDTRRENLETALHKLVKFPEPIMLYYDTLIRLEIPAPDGGLWQSFKRIFSQTPEKLLKNKIKTFLTFWNDISNIEAEKSPFAIKTDFEAKPILVFLFFNYENFAEPEKPYEQLNDRMHEYISTLSFDDYPNLVGVVLEKIKPVGERSVHEWLYRGDVFRGLHEKKICKFDPRKCITSEVKCNLNSVQTEVEDYFKSNERVLKNRQENRGRVRMKFWIEFLNEKLNSIAREKI
jgi:hypothetical protein